MSKRLKIRQYEDLHFLYKVQKQRGMDDEAKKTLEKMTELGQQIGLDGLRELAGLNKIGGCDE